MTEELVANLYHFQDWFILNQAGDKIIYLLGLFIFLGWLAALLAKRIKLPVIVSYIFLGILLNVELIEHIPFLSTVQKAWYGFVVESFDYLPQLALAFVAFTIGSELSLRVLKNLGSKVKYIVFCEVVASFSLVTIGMLVLGQPIYLALIFGAIAIVTSPAATVMVLQEYESEGMLTSVILAVVAIDAVIALIIFSFVEPIAFMLYSGATEVSIAEAVLNPIMEVGFSIGLGLAIGYFSQKLLIDFTDKTKKILTVVATIVGGASLANFLGLAPLIANMTIGFAYRNFVRKNLGIADYLDTLTIPLYAFFFILAGTKFKFSVIASAGFLLIAFTYILTRVLAKLGGASLGAKLAEAPAKIKKYIGWGLFPQSGVAIALAYTVQQNFAGSEVGNLVFNTLIFSAALSEVFGPLATKYAVFGAGEAKGEPVISQGEK